jgi:hypothetical protein
MSASAWHQFIFIGGLGFVVAGLTTYIITWALVSVTLRDRHAAERDRLGGMPFTPRIAGWFLAARWRSLRDRTLDALALPGSIGAWAIIVGAIMATAAKLLSLTGASP